MRSGRRPLRVRLARMLPAVPGIPRMSPRTPRALPAPSPDTMLDLLILDAAGKPARPWLTTVVDDHSRAIAGTMVFIGAPSILNTSLALRQAIWRKANPSWPVCGIPDVLYVDHGSDFTSNHLDQVAASMHFRIVYSGVGRPQGRGKIERLFGTLNTELLPELPGHLVNGKPATPPRLSLAELDAAIAAYLRRPITAASIARSAQRRLMRGAGTDSCRACPKASKTSICCS
jgi:transposase InsO family protein